MNKMKIKRLLERAGFLHVSGWLPSGKALRAQAQIDAYKAEVERLKAEAEHGKPEA